MDARYKELWDSAQSSDEDKSEIAWSDLFREYGVWKGAPRDYEEDLY